MPGTKWGRYVSGWRLQDYYGVYECSIEDQDGVGFSKADMRCDERLVKLLAVCRPAGTKLVGQRNELRVASIRALVTTVLYNDCTLHCGALSVYHRARITSYPKETLTFDDV